jgi:hypothetical protein
MRKIIFSFCFVFSFLIFLARFANSVYSQSSFSTDSFVIYDIDENGNAFVGHEINLENKVPEVYAKSYTMSLMGFKPEEVKAKSDGLDIAVNQQEKDNKTSIELDFPDVKVGKGAIRKITLNYKISNFAKKTGKIWEVYLPRQEDIESFNSYRVNVLVPEIFGNLIYSSPEAKSKFTKDGKVGFEFDKEVLTSKTGVTLGFGDTQIFSFTLNYHLENPLNKEAKTKIALPPDTSFQRVFYESIEPKPKNILIDNDGNWLAEYYLGPREIINVKAIGFAQIFPNPQKILSQSEDSLYKNTLPQTYWETEDPRIKNLAQNLKTVKDVYNYVVETLNYDYSRAKPNVQRLGAKAILENPNSAICMEFTDLFIAILRAKGIPAREINGFAYSEDSKLLPLSLVSDVLHAWPEYWDERQKVWIPVDPTWQKTSRGADFFNKQDLRHFAFVIHGESSTYPPSAGSYKLGYQPERDVFVSLGGKPELINEKVSIDIQIVKEIPLVKYKAKFIIANNGQSALYNQDADIFFDGKFVKKENIKVLLPFSSYEFELDIPFSFLGKNTPAKISLSILNNINEVRGVKDQVIMMNILAIFIVVIILVSLIIFKFGRIKLFPFLSNFFKHKKDI